MASLNFVICEHCDAVYRRGALRPGEVARCGQCGAELYRRRHLGLDAMLALTVAGLVAFLVANSYPVMQLDLGGTSSAATLWQIVLATYDAGVGPVAVMTAAAVFLFPLLQIGLFTYVLAPLRLGRKPHEFTAAMHMLRQMRPWSMVEVFLLGALVSVVKLTAVASVTAEPGLWGFAALTFLLTALNSFDLHALWDHAGEIGA
ncbi:MAG: paraquat-inducible protein A [Stenotrophobium sp.]